MVMVEKYVRQVLSKICIVNLRSLRVIDLSIEFNLICVYVYTKLSFKYFFSWRNIRTSILGKYSKTH